MKHLSLFLFLLNFSISLIATNRNELNTEDEISIIYPNDSLYKKPITPIQNQPNNDETRIIQLLKIDKSNQNLTHFFNFDTSFERRTFNIFCKRIKNFDFSNSNISNNDITLITKFFPNLQSLNLVCCFKISDAAITALAACPQLLFLDLSCCNQITDAGITALAQGCQQLQELNLTNCHQITNAGIIALAACQQLQKLNLSCCNQITDAGITALAQGCPQIQSLNLTWCKNITNAVITALATCQKLQSLNLLGCRNISDAAITEFDQARIRLGLSPVNITR